MSNKTNELFKVPNNSDNSDSEKLTNKKNKRRNRRKNNNNNNIDSVQRNVNKVDPSGDIELTEADYWHINKLLGTNSDINLVVGQRGNGKSFAVADYVLDRYGDNGKKFIYLRRWDTDLKSYRINKLFEDENLNIEGRFGVGYYIKYWQHSFRLMNDEDELVDIIGYAESLNEAHHTKSIPYNDCDTIWFDEFIPMKGERSLNSELNMYENFLSTVIRSRTDVKVFMLANTVSKFSPYFTHWGFNINKITQGSINTKEFETDAGILRVTFEYCEFNERIARKTSKYIKSNMIVKGEWEIEPTDDIPTTTNEIVKDRLLFSAVDPDTSVNIACYVRHSIWETLETVPGVGIYIPKRHHRQFLILKQSTDVSHYYHLSEHKSLTYSSWMSLDLMLTDILNRVGIDVRRELMMGRVFCDNPFTADYFNHIWKTFMSVPITKVL